MLEINNINKTFDSKTILQEITFQVNESEICGILGKNGAGKTTLLKIISNIFLADSGEIYLDNRAIHNHEFYSIFGVERSLYWTISVYENILYFSRLKGIDKKIVDHKLQYADELIFVKPLLNQNTGKLSLGQKQLVLLSILIIVNPKILCLDEPSNGLDIQNQKNLENLLLQCSREMNSIIIISSHDINFLYNICDKFVIFSEGKIIASVNKKENSLERLKDIYLKIIENQSNEVEEK